MDEKPEAAESRREFCKKAAAVALGGVAAVVPLSAGVVVFFDPLGRKGGGASFVRVTSLEALPADGVPRKFTVISGRVDAWNRMPQTPIGAIYLRRTGERELQAMNASCPHAGCLVDYRTEGETFFCPCHNSRFELNGEIIRPSPSPRRMDDLRVEVREDGSVWVEFQNFLAGHAQKLPA